MGIKSFRRRLSHSVCVLALLCLIVALLKPGSREREGGRFGVRGAGRPGSGTCVLGLRPGASALRSAAWGADSDHRVLPIF